jgi:NADH-quinone oxidoreductase subunit H
VLKGLGLIIPLLLSTAYFTLAERKVLASIQIRIGPNVVGFFGILQPLADGLKLALKETILPLAVDIFVFLFSPIITFTLSLAAWGVIPFNNGFVIADIELGLLYLFAISGLGVYGIILAGWSSNSRFAFMGAIRSAAQMISYEVSLGLILISLLLLAGSLNFSEIVQSQDLVVVAYGENKSIWYIFPLFPLAIKFFISAIAETNRAPFDLVESESELVAGPFIEYSSVSLFGQFFLAEMASILLYSTLFVLLFFGGWFTMFWQVTNDTTFWLAVKVIFSLLIFLFARAAMPRFRYDQLNRLGWRIFLPISLSFILFYGGVSAVFDLLPQDPFYTVDNRVLL